MNYKAIIHIARNQLGMPDAVYRDMLHGLTGKGSTAEMTAGEMAKVVAHLQREWGFRIRKKASAEHRTSNVQPRTEEKGRKRYDELGERPGMATPAQLRMLEAIWRDAARTPTDEAYRKFLSARFGVSHPRFVPFDQVTAIRAAMLRMKESATAKNTENAKGAR